MLWLKYLTLIIYFVLSLCSSGFTGPNCEIKKSVCSPSPCLNFGLCQENYNGGFTCICTPGTTGVRCETNITGKKRTFFKTLFIKSLNIYIFKNVQMYANLDNVLFKMVLTLVSAFLVTQVLTVTLTLMNAIQILVQMGHYVHSLL